jgi:hypothetical protein
MVGVGQHRDGTAGARRGRGAVTRWWALGLAWSACLVACAGMRSTPASRYEGILLNARELGAAQIAREAASDPTVKAYVAQHPHPDFVLVASPTDFELVYVQRSVLAYFHRPAADAPSVVREVTPLPSGLFQMLPPDLRAGTALPMNAGGLNCWTVAVADQRCRTCCLGPGACSVQCTPAAAS